MGKDELPVLTSDRRHEHAKDVEGSTDDDQMTEVPCVEEWAGDAA